jgi:hypothetical protein
MKISWTLRAVRPIAAMVIALAGSRASAQSGCMQGNVFNSFGVNQEIKLCPLPGSKVPELQKQLDEIQKSLSGNEALLREIAHTARGVNALGRDVDANRQVELLRSFSRQLTGLMAGGQEKSMQQIAQLADRLDALQDSITQSKEDRKTAQQTTAALNGQLGDAVAALDFTNAQQQLDSIQAKLDKIGDDTREIRRTIEEQAAREKEAAELTRKKAEEQDKDPNMYTRAQIMPSRSPLDNLVRLMIFFYSRPPLYPPFVDSAFSVAFRKGTGAAWRVDATDKQPANGGELWRLNLKPDDLGDRATLCFVAHDKPSGRLREWTQRYKVTSANTPSAAVNFIQDGDAAMRLTDGEPCDGATEVRKEATPAAGAAAGSPATTLSMDEQVKQQTAKMQETIAAMRDQARKTKPPSANFARITAGGSRRDQTNGGQWQIEVKTQPFRPGEPLYDVHVEANLIDESGRVTALQLSNRQIFVNIETRSAWVNRMGAKAVVCLTAKDPALDKPYRLTQWFSIETTRVNWTQGGAQIPGEKATFVPAKPAELTEASNAACQ